MADLSPAASSLTLLSGPSEDRVCGEAITAGQCVYLDAADSEEAKVADANAAGKKTVKGIALDPGSEGDTIRIALSGSRIVLGDTLGVGTPYFLSSNAGGICPLADVGSGEDLVVVGAGETAAILSVHIWNSAIAHA